MQRGLILAAGGALGLLLAAGAAGAQTLNEALAARQKALGKGKRAFQETYLTAPKGVASEKELKLAAKVAVFQEAPRERLEIQPVAENAFGETVVVVSNGKGYHLVTKVGSTPLEKSAKASDPLVLMVLGSPAGEAPKRREVKGADGKLTGVVYRESRSADFSSSTAFSMKQPKVGGALLKKGLASFAESDETTVTASAGARGVDEIETPEGKVSVTPDSSAVVWLDGRVIGPVAFEGFLREGELGPYGAEETP